MLPRKMGEANRTEQKFLLEEDGEKYHTNIAIVVAHNSGVSMY